LRWFHTFMFFLGALTVYIFQKKSPQKAEEFSFPIASGVIAGASLMGILIIFCDNGSGIAAMIKQMFTMK